MRSLSPRLACVAAFLLSTLAPASSTAADGPLVSYGFGRGTAGPLTVASDMTMLTSGAVKSRPAFRTFEIEASFQSPMSMYPVGGLVMLHRFGVSSTCTVGDQTDISVGGSTTAPGYF